MSTRGHYPAGVPCWVETLQPDPEAAMGFYNSLFGWDFVGPGPMPGDPSGGYFVARVNGHDVSGLACQPPAAAGRPQWLTHICVEDAAPLPRGR